MQFFVKYNAAGDILSVSAVEVMPAGMEHPYSDLKADEHVLEVPPMPELESGNLIQLQTNYRMDVTKKQLVEKTSS